MRFPRACSYSAVSELPFQFVDSEINSAILSAVEGRIHQQLIPYGSDVGATDGRPPDAAAGSGDAK